MQTIYMVSATKILNEGGSSSECSVTAFICRTCSLKMIENVNFKYRLAFIK